VSGLVTVLRRPSVGLLVGLVVIGAVGFAPLSYHSYGIVVQVYVLAGAAVSWNIIGGYAGQLSLGHAASFGLAAYTAAWLTAEHGAPLVVALTAAMAVSAVTSLVLVPCFRARGAYFAILTLAFVSIVDQLARQYAPNGNSGLLFDSFPVTSRAPLQLLTAGLLASIVVTFLVMRSRVGKGLRAIRLDLDAARSVGVDDVRMRTLALVLACALNGWFGAVYALNLGFLDPDTAFNLQWSITPVLAAILGGTATLYGPVAGAAVWVAITELISAGDLSGGAPLVIQGAALLLITVLLPRGLAGLSGRLTRRRPAAAPGRDDPHPGAVALRDLEESAR
jgi:branched-chain amino acid transport system permease protein